MLIEGARIAAVGQSLAADNAQVIDAREMIVMPGFIDSHRHMWEGAIRNLIPDANLRDYLTVILGKYGPAYRPEDVYIGDLVSALSALDAGITTIVDWSHIQNTPAHTDAAIRALQESGMRAMFAYGFPQLGGKPWWVETSSHQFPGDIARLRKQYFLLRRSAAHAGARGDRRLRQHGHCQARMGGGARRRRAHHRACVGQGSARQAQQCHQAWAGYDLRALRRLRRR